jgi:hypothetical protein
MDITLIKYKDIYDLIYALLSEHPLQPFYTLNKYRGYVYFYEAIAEIPAIYYVQSDIEDGTYLFDIIKKSLIKQERIPKITEQGQFLLILKSLLKDSLIDDVFDKL